MSIASAISDLQGRVADAYAAISARGGTLPATQNTASLPTAISSIPAEKSMYGVNGLESILSSAGGILYYWADASDLHFDGVSTMPAGGMAGAFSFRGAINTVSFPNLTKAYQFSFYETFRNSGVSAVSFDGYLKMNNNRAFVRFAAFDNGLINTPKLQSVSFASLSSIGVGSFSAFTEGCMGQSCLTSFSMPSLKSISSGYRAGQGTTNNTHAVFSKCFAGCSALTSLTFPELTCIVSHYQTGMPTNGQGTFADNDCLEVINLPKVSAMTNQDYMFYGCTALTAIHFGAANQAAISATSGYSTKWGAPNSNCQIYFDL